MVSAGRRAGASAGIRVTHNPPLWVVVASLACPNGDISNSGRQAEHANGSRASDAPLHALWSAAGP
jgi:hypothetical protein